MIAEINRSRDVMKYRTEPRLTLNGTCYRCRIIFLIISLFLIVCFLNIGFMFFSCVLLDRFREQFYMLEIITVALIFVNKVAKVNERQNTNNNNLINILTNLFLI